MQGLHAFYVSTVPERKHKHTVNPQPLYYLTVTQLLSLCFVLWTPLVERCHLSSGSLSEGRSYISSPHFGGGTACTQYILCGYPSVDGTRTSTSWKTIFEKSSQSKGKCCHHSQWRHTRTSRHKCKDSFFPAWLYISLGGSHTSHRGFLTQ